MHTVHAYRRNSHKYNDSYRHLDSETFVATVKLTPPRVTVEGNGYDEGESYVQYGRIPANVNKGALLKALKDTLSKHGCSHEYDCCGCASYRVNVRLIAPRRLMVFTKVSYNY